MKNLVTLLRSLVLYWIQCRTLSGGDIHAQHPSRSAHPSACRPINSPRAREASSKYFWYAPGVGKTSAMLKAAAAAKNAELT